ASGRGNIFLSAAAGIEAGTLQAGGSITSESGAATSIASATADGAIILRAGGDLTVGALNSGDEISGEAGGALDVETTVAGGAVSFAADESVRVGTVTAAGTLELTARGGSITSDGTLTAATLKADSSADLALNNVAVTSDLVLATANGGISANSLSSEGSISLTASEAIALANGSAGGDFSAEAASMLLGSLTAAGDIALDSSGNLALGSALAGGEFRANAGADGTFGAIGATAVTIEALGTATFNGGVVAGEIAVASSDINVAEGGGLGGEGTQLVFLRALGNGQPTVLGGSEQGPGYTLDEAEAGRIVAGTLRIEAPQNGTGANRPADFLVRNLALDAARVGRLEVATGGIIQVEGALRLANAGTTNAVLLSAGERIQLITPTGSVRVQGANGLPAGTLTLDSRDIWAANEALIAQLTADPNFAGRDAALLANNGEIAPRGYIEGGDVELLASNSVFVQNSGTATSFAGITVVGDTLTVTPTGTTPLSVFAFGRRINPDGSFVTNEEFFREVQFQKDGAGFTDEAQFNLCFINSGICGPQTPDLQLPGGPDPIKEPLNRPSAQGRDPELVDTSFASDPLIEEPVTSGADSILWDCDEDDDRDCDREDGNE
ncbi:MAG: hypothetical protein M3177_08355, partial [Pseudomonadota bacterium]|nr:hypothetical protein [Pseudomonadota bacterium]